MAKSKKKRWRTDYIYTMTKRKMIKGQTMIYKTLDRKLKIDQREPHYKPGIHSGHPEE
jgi:hypothetical protein